MGCGNSKAASDTAHRAPPSQTPNSDPPAVKTKPTLVQSQETAKRQDAPLLDIDTIVSTTPLVQPQKPQVALDEKSSALIDDGDHVSQISVHLDDMSEVDQIDFANSPDRPTKQQQELLTKGDIDFQQYLNWPDIQDLQSRYPVLLEDEILEEFEVMDTDMDGYISIKQGEDIVFLLEAKLNPLTTETPPLAIVHVGSQTVAENALTKPLTKMTRTTPPPKTNKAKKPIKFVSDAEDPPSTTLDDFSQDWIPGSSSSSSSKPPVAPASPSTMTTAAHPPIKKGFLMQTAGSISSFSPPNSPTSSNGNSSANKSARNRYHVLDAGVLFHLDSHSSTPPFTFDRRGGVDLKDRKLSVRNDGILELSKNNSDSAEDIVYLSIKGEDERKEWIESLQEHLIFAQHQNRLNITV